MAGRRKLRIKLSEAQNHRCAYCTETMSLDYMQPTSATLEHVVPSSHGGSNHESNLVVACYSCNHARGNTSLIYFLCSRNPKYKRNPEDAAYISELYRVAKPPPKPIVPTLPHRIAAVAKLRERLRGFSVLNSSLCFSKTNETSKIIVDKKSNPS